MQKHDHGTVEADGGVAAAVKVAVESSEGMFDERREAPAREDDGAQPVIGAETRTRTKKFEAAARAPGCDPDEAQSTGALRKLARLRVHLP